MKNADLWRRIGEYRMDGRFEEKLARENGWSLEFAARVVREYRRFAYLAIAAGHMASPSDAVDQAWHLHLTYSQSYWDDFCGKALGRPLHHHPSKGGDRKSVV